MKDKLIVIIGPTASGKSELAVKIAKKYNGEIISADSRQIYKGLDIGSGKVEGKWNKNRNIFLYKNIPHYLIDEASPLRQYSVARFQKKASGIIKDIISRGKVPIICGGTGHWVDSLVFGEVLPEVKPDTKLRAKLSKLTTTQIYKKLQKLDHTRAKNIDPKNPRRLIRALEIVMTTGKPVPPLKAKSPYRITWIGLNPGKEILDKNIARRLRQRLQGGMIAEVKKIRRSPVSWRRLESFGLEYKFVALFLQNKLTRTELEEQLLRAIGQYAKRQMTWWKRNKEIKWFESSKKVQI